MTLVKTLFNIYQTMGEGEEWSHWCDLGRQSIRVQKLTKMQEKF